MAISADAIARVVGIDVEAVNLQAVNTFSLPQRIAVVGQGSTASVYSTTKQQVTSAFQAGTLYGFGSPVHLAVSLLLPTNGTGVGTIPVTVYPLVDDGAGVVSTGDIIPSGAPSGPGNYKVVINNIESEVFIIATADSVATIVAAMTAAINAVVEMPVVAVDGATQVDITSKWKGTSANDIYMEVVGPTDLIVTFAVTQPVGGATNPNIDAALAQIGGVWETLLLNCLDIADTDTLDKYSLEGETRWGALVRKPLIVFTGSIATTVSAATAVSDARKTDRVNAQLVEPGGVDLPFVVAARQLSVIAVIANANAPVDYGSQPAVGLTPGVDGDQWLYVQRDAAVKAGSSTIEVRDGVVVLSDIITFYHPTGDPVPAYRYVVDIIKLQNVIYSLDLTFVSPEWDGAPLIPDGQATTNPAARSPKSAVTAVATVLDGLGLRAIISDPDTAKRTITAAINGSNPKRLDIGATIQLSGNINVVDIPIKFGFLFGA